MKSVPNTCKYNMTRETSSLYWNLLNIKDGNVLDVGSGQGGFALSAPPSVSLFGVERDAKVIGKCSGYKEIRKINIGTDTLPFDNDFFNGVLARDILEHLDKPWIVLDEIYTQMKSGGTLLVSVPKPDPKIVWNDFTHVRGFTKNALKSLIENSGFVVRDIFLMSGFTIASKYGFTRFLPALGKIPGVRSFFVSYHCIAYKSKK